MVSVSFQLKISTTILRIGDNRRIVLDAKRRPVHADQTILAANLPVIRQRIPAMLDASEEPFRPRAIARRSCRLRNGYQIFRAGKQKRIAIVQSYRGIPLEVLRLTPGMLRLQPKPKGPFPLPVL